MHHHSRLTHHPHQMLRIRLSLEEEGTIRCTECAAK